MPRWSCYVVTPGYFQHFSGRRKLTRSSKSVSRYQNHYHRCYPINEKEASKLSFSFYPRVSGGKVCPPSKVHIVSLAMSRGVEISRRMDLGQRCQSQLRLARCFRHAGGRASAGLVVCGGLFPLLAPRVVEMYSVEEGETRKVEAGWSCAPDAQTGPAGPRTKEGGKR